MLEQTTMSGGSDEKPVKQSRDLSAEENCSYALRNQINAAIELLKNPKFDVNVTYRRSRRYDREKQERAFEPKTETRNVDKSKPCIMRLGDTEMVVPDPKIILLLYVQMFQDQIDQDTIDLNVVKSLVDSGVDINLSDEYGQSLLHAFVRDWHSDVTLFAIRHGANVNAQDRFGRTPLHLAVALNYADTARILMKHGADPNTETISERITPVHIAARCNSMDAMRALMHYGGCITKRDKKGRTPSIIASMEGSDEVVHFLLDVEASFGVYDKDGNSALNYLIEKLPRLSFKALGQFLVFKNSKECHLYLGQLEADFENMVDGVGCKRERRTKTPLELITVDNDTSLIMHPVIQKSIEIKWNMFGRKDSLIKLFITFVYVACWLVLAYTFPDTSDFYFDPDGNWDENGWKVAFEIFIVIFAVYFFFKDLILIKRQRLEHDKEIKFRRALVRNQYVYCHPAWPGEREHLDYKAENVAQIASLVGKYKIWFLYECMILLLLAAVIASRVFSMIFHESSALLLIHKVIFVVNMMFSFLRIFKIGMRFPYFSVVVKVAGSCFTSFIQIVLLYLQVYVPFVVAFWVMFGVYIETDDVSNNKDVNTNRNTSQAYLQRLSATSNSTNTTSTESTVDTYLALKRLNHLFFLVYGVSFGQEDLYHLSSFDFTAFQPIISLYHIIATFVTLSIIIGMVTARFKILYQQCVAESLLFQAYVILLIEKDLSEVITISLFVRSQRV